MDSVRVLAFDPSLINLGVSCGISSASGLVIESAQTYKIDQLITKLGERNSWGRNVNLLRMQYATRVVEYCMRCYDPDVVILEDPIYNKRNPDSLITQSRGLGIFESAIAKHFINNGRMPNQTNYKPNIIKLGVGVPKGRFKEKEAITESLLDLVKSGKLQYVNDKHSPLNVDDHANDAVAMVYNKHLEILDVLV
jgi:Holliday junction resolvasome RuvABC endonuclease subunit